MKKSIIIGLVLIILGICLFGVSAFNVNFNLTRLSTATEPVANNESFDNVGAVTIKSCNTDIILLPSANDQVTVSWCDTVYYSIKVENNNNTLKIETIKNSLKMAEYLNINLYPKAYNIIVNIPVGYEGIINIESVSADIEANGIVANHLLFNSEKGDGKFKKCTFTEDLGVNTEKGKIDAESLISNGNIVLNCKKDLELESIKANNLKISSNNDVEFENIDALEFTVDSQKDVKGTVLGNINDYTIVANSKKSSNIKSGGNGNKKLNVNSQKGKINIDFN